ncbi:MAG: amino acid adenylation domain-containing protein, partial [Pseudomonadota bacterium]
DTLRTRLQAQLPDYMVPTAWLVLDRLPRTPNGKLDNRALPEPGEAAADAHVDPATPTEQAVAEIWAQLLKRETVSATANFFALGGNSLLATRVVSAVAERLHKRVAVRSVFEHASVRAFARHIDDQATTIHQAIPAVARDADLPLSFAQQRLWFIDELEGGTPQYNMPVAVRLRGALDGHALQTALDTLVARHEVLRTTYVTQGDQAVQRIAPVAPVAIARLTTEADLDDETLSALIAAEARRPFRLGQEAPLRVSLLSIASDDHVVLFTLHHIASDGWSMGLVIEEFVSAYEAALTRTAPRLAALPVQYADYAHWQRERLQGETLQQQLDYWRQQLAGIPAVHGLPLDHARPAQQQFSGARLSRRVDAATRQRIDQLARAENATPFMLLQAVFALLLGRWSGEEDIVMGTPVAGRVHRDLEHLVGFFVNTLVLRTDLSGDPSFRQLLARSRTMALAAQAHQELPFEMLVDALQPARSLSHTPVFQIMFSLRNHVQGRRALSLPGLALELVNPASDSVKFDLELIVSETEQGLAFEWLYATSLFDATSIERLALGFERLLAAVLATPDQAVHAIELLAEQERTPILRLADAARAAGLVTQDFDAHVCAAPHAVAVEFGSETLSYAELDARANQVAHCLQVHRLRADDVVAICFERSVDMIVALLGVLKAGAAYLPLDPAYPAERLRYMLDDSRAVCVLSHRAAAASVPATELPLLLLDADQALADAPTQSVALAPQAGGLQLAYLIYTSGSSGKPKGVMSHHAGAINLARNLRRVLDADARSRVLQFASMSFDAAVWDWLLALSSGACLVICPAEVRQSPEALATFLVEQRITHAILPPALLPHMDETRGYSLRALAVGGEACDPQAAWRWAARVPLFNAYGPTEASVCVSIARVVPARRISIGHALDGVELRVLNRAGVEQPIGVAGELQIGGIGVSRGYLGRSELTAAAFTHDLHDPSVRRYRTGDRVRRLADGALEFLGRIDEQVKLRGFRIELGEIEWQLRQCTGVRDVAVLVRGEASARRLVAYVVADPAGVTPQHLSRSVRAQLPEHMVPSAYVFLEALPLTVNGKLDKRALPEPAAPAADVSSAPRNATEQALCEIWQRLLRVPQVGIHDNFFAIGGDSILSTQVVARANQAGLRLTTRQMFEHQTIAELAELVESAHATQAPQHAQTGALPLTPIQRRFFAESGVDIDHYNQAVLLTTPPDFDGACLPHLARALYERHDALRLAFTRERGEWVAQHRPLSLAMIEDAVAIERLPDDEEGDARCLAERGQHWQRSLDIGQARLWRMVQFEGKGRSGRLLIVVHHLVVDGVSWRVMLSDLERAYRQYASGADVHLAAKTSAFAQWGAALQQHATDPGLQAQRHYWLDRYAVPVAPLPQDFATEATPALATTERINLSLSENDTRALLQRCGAAYRTQINELLLAGVYLGLQRWTGRHGVRVALEGHGREPLFDDLDVTETVGWFTSLYPLTLLADSVLPGEVIKAVKEQYRAVPGHGIGY